MGCPPREPCRLPQLCMGSGVGCAEQVCRELGYLVDTAPERKFGNCSLEMWLKAGVVVQTEETGTRLGKLGSEWPGSSHDPRKLWAGQRAG